MTAPNTRHTETVLETIVFYLIVGTVVLGLGLDLGYRAWRKTTRPRQSESTPAASPSPTEEPQQLPVDDA